ncbi:Mediator of RNA polymerase II transcription subunit 7 [Amphibalanus amphitrite]|uniref:Mediator of RNA polymerase II transcription subunit 7 n=1 Tax=Amphibalanus amphitrite TaxID=1232801 RepID=A0A6A4WC37_AMPAM|nr:Mediator of RNA polymerase II transcription subunit 7 [Amphibalanus amphitrite]
MSGAGPPMAGGEAAVASSLPLPSAKTYGLYTDENGIKRLYPINFDHRKELKKLNHSVLANFLDLLEILIRCPDSSKRIEKIDDIKLLFIHMHHLINEFRPHQAREALRVTMELQKRNRLEIADRFELHLEKVMETVNGALSALSSREEFDSKLLVPTEVAPRPADDPEQPPTDRLTELDALMCHVMDTS